MANLQIQLSEHLQRKLIL